MKSKEKIYLVGMPGAGKSTFGVDLAEAMKLPFVDLDKEIEATEGKSITEIFQSEGEGYFRQLESKLLNEISNSSSNFVMSTGGGTPCYHQGIEVMLEKGIVVYLQVPLQTLVQRLEKTDLTKRPKFEKDNKIHEQLGQLLAEREKVYKQADLIIEERELKAFNVIEKIKGI
ncbi:shikimate kinase [Fulvivirga sp. RKSG066]|uniref:shikimate kinase n=1 Tax=Fulvivirga aurantia TaxID=2529383 RepID=UPI0012BD5208|nr:shikimate kinase [Fulvivirga aurantia]MTI22264.1 shikimate kinase [Fulvivirga aurantia]